MFNRLALAAVDASEPIILTSFRLLGLAAGLVVASLAAPVVTAIRLTAAYGRSR